MSHGGSPSIPTPLPSPRVIPACAGNATSSPGWIPARTVYPRMCGERRCVSRLLKRQYGSSPHARGTHGWPQTRKPLPRFIPACAGNAGHVPARGAPDPVHPRMRGERAGRAHRARRASGSSPHARGTPPRAPWAGHICRFIPACAGNAARADRFPGLVSVHPRMRGERDTTVIYSLPPVGSSPHARGTPLWHLGRHFQARFIPACAGNAEGVGGWSVAAAVHPRMRGERSHLVLVSSE